MLGKSQIKYIQSLGQKKVRDEEGVYIAEGPKIVAELLESNAGDIQAIYSLEEWSSEHIQTINKIDHTIVDEIELGKISQLSTPNQVVAVVKKAPAVNIDAANTITLVLDALQDPGNLGTIIRIADWFGVEQIVCSKDSADIYNPKVVQSTMGSLVRVKVLYTDLMDWLSNQNDVPVYAAALDGKDIASFKKLKEGIIIIGNESKGISNAVMELAGEKITIPKKGKAESLNAAVATGILLSHLI